MNQAIQTKSPRARAMIRRGLACVVCLLSLPVAAATLFEQSPMPAGDGFFSSIGAGAQNADSFSVTAPVKLSEIIWWGSYDPELDSDAFDVRVLDSASSAPAALIAEPSTGAVTRTLTSLVDVAGGPVYQYNLVLAAPLTLGPGTHYLSVMNETGTSAWYWLASDDGDDVHWIRAEDGDTWEESATGDFAFRLEGVPLSAIPLPGAFVLMASAVLVLTGSRGRRER